MPNEDYREAQQQARDHGLKARQEARLENATYTAAEMKVLTEAALRLGRDEGIRDVIRDVTVWVSGVEDEAVWDEWSSRRGAILRAYGIQKAAPDASEPRTDPGMGMDLPPEPKAVREPVVDLVVALRKSVAAARERRLTERQAVREPQEEA